MKRKMFWSVLGILGIFVFLTTAGAQDYPTKPIIMQVPYPAGGSTDVGARIVSAIAEKQIGPTYRCHQQARRRRTVGLDRIGKGRNPTDTTLDIISMPHMLSAILDPERKSTFKAEDITPIISQALDPTTISVRPDSWKTLKELIDDAKKRPGEIKAGIVGYLQDDEIGYLQFAEAAGVQLRLVYFDGAAPAITALLGKHVDVLFCTVGDNFQPMEGGEDPHADDHGQGAEQILSRFADHRRAWVPRGYLRFDPGNRSPQRNSPAHSEEDRGHLQEGHGVKRAPRQAGGGRPCR